MALRSPRSPPPMPSTTPKGSPRAHRRRHSHVPVVERREDDELDRGALFFRSAVASPHYPFYGGDAEYASSSRRQASPTTSRRRPSNSPTSQQDRRTPSPESTASKRRTSLRRSPASEGGLVPSLSRREEEETLHGQVLRARLERVLVHGRVLDRELSPSRGIVPLDLRRNRSRTDPPPPSSAIGVPPVQRASTSPALLVPREKGFRKSTGNTPPLVASGSASASASGSQSGGSGESVSDEEGLLTPPPTPPSFPSLSPLPSSSPTSSTSPSKKATLSPTPRLPPHLQTHDTRPAFNARQASLHCRQIEGYVSFSAVEGLGAPPEPGTPTEDEEGKRERGRGGVWDWTKRLVGGGGEER
ncbi:hypothetical protein BDQ17DRAFT_419553 [Cyathus striatus]|nr:hypothetical protein BDQ17DRAFT_419553 [Cyathus striatus]